MKSVIILPAIILCGLFVHAFVAEAETSLDRQATKLSVIISGKIMVEGGRSTTDSQIQAIPVGARPDENYQTSCDNDGNFKFTGLRSGAYLIQASLPGYVPLRRSSEPEVYRVGDVVTINMVKGGVITGRVTDAYGESMVKVRVTPQLARDPEGRRIPSFPLNSFGSGFGSITDDRGVYRIYGLEPGSYLLSVTGDVPNEFFGPENRSRETATFYPSANRDTAGEVAVRGGEEVTGIDIRHRGERGRGVSGIIIGAAESNALINVVVVALRNPVQGNIEAMTAVIGSAKFAMVGVPDGDYLISAHRGNEINQQSASVPRRLSVRGGDLSGIELRLLALGSIAGQVVIETGGGAGGMDNCVKEEPGLPGEVTLNAQLSEKGRRAASLPLGVFGLPEGSDGSVPHEKS